MQPELGHRFSSDESTHSSKPLQRAELGTHSPDPHWIWFGLQGLVSNPKCHPKIMHMLHARHKIKHYRFRSWLATSCHCESPLRGWPDRPWTRSPPWCTLAVRHYRCFWKSNQEWPTFLQDFWTSWNKSFWVFFVKSQPESESYANFTTVTNWVPGTFL